MPIERRLRLLVMLILCMVILVLHLMPRPSIETWHGRFFNAYLVDILLPAYLFVLFSLNTFRLSDKFRMHPLQTRLFMAGFVFLIGVTIETLQYFHVPILGRTFDPLDFLMYLFGVMIGLGIDFCVVRGSEMIKNRVS